MLLLIFTTTAACLLSLLTNNAIEQHLHAPISLLGNWLGLQLAHNPGIAFSVELHWLELPVIFGALLVVAIMAVAHGQQSIWMRIGFGLILGGAVANLIDRLQDGVVTDYVQVSTFPIFNAADSCITIGIALLMLEQLWRQTKPAAESPRKIR